MPDRPHQPAVHESFVRSAAARLYVRDVGRGLPVIVLHGGPDFDHAYLLPELDGLARRFRLVYYDQRGRGRSFSGEGPGDVSLATEIDDLDRVREWTRSDSVALLGHSWGGLLALEYAIRHPGRVSHLILMNVAPASHAGVLALRRELAAIRSPEQAARMTALASDPGYQAGELGPDAEYYRIHFGTTLRRPEQLDLLVGRLRAGFTREGIVAARAIEQSLYAETWSREGYDLLPHLGDLRVPALVIHGEHDLIPLSVARQIAAAIPGSRLVVLAGCGHFAYLEQPDRVRSRIARFLARGRPSAIAGRRRVDVGRCPRGSTPALCSAAMAVRSAARAPRAAARTAAPARPAKWTVPPVLVRQVRNGVVESVHRGDVVEVDAAGRMLRVLGDPERVVSLRSTVKPFGLLALLRAGGVREFDLTPEELAVMASSHSGEDVHVRTILAMYRRVGVSQVVLACGTEGMPLDALTASRLARDGERPGPIRHMCSGQHSVFILLAKLGGWPQETYWQADHPAHVAYREAVALAYGTAPDRMRTAIDGCGVLTYAFPLREVARAFAILADPSAIPVDDPRAELARHLVQVRDAMLRHPELVAGTRDRLDTSLMKAAAGRLVSKSGMEALRGIGILPGPRTNGPDGPASGMAVKIEDGDGYDRGTWAASVEALRQAGVLEAQALRVLARYHRPAFLDPHGRTGAESIPEFELAPVGELVG